MLFKLLGHLLDRRQLWLRKVQFLGHNCVLFLYPIQLILPRGHVHRSNILYGILKPVRRRRIDGADIGKEEAGSVFGGELAGLVADEGVFAWTITQSSRGIMLILVKFLVRQLLQVVIGRRRRRCL